MEIESGYVDFDDLSILWNDEDGDDDIVDADFIYWAGGLWGIGYYIEFIVLCLMGILDELIHSTRLDYLPCLDRILYKYCNWVQTQLHRRMYPEDFPNE